MSPKKKDQVVGRLSMLCVLAGLHPLAWWHLTATEFEAIVRARATS